jgi:hypothetical protein
MINERERVRFRVISWNPEKQRGVANDRQGCSYPINVGSLAPECEDGQVAVGDILSGFVVDFETLGDLIIESGSSPIRERNQLDSVGQYSEAKGSWEPRGTPHDALSGGRPDTGDARTRGR